MNRCRERLPPSAPDFLFKEASPKPYDYAKFPENSSAARASCAGGVKKALPELYQFLVGMVSNPTIVAAYGGVHQYTEKPQAYNCLRPVFLPFNSRAISEYEPEPPIGQHSHLIYRGIPQTFIEFCNQPLFP